MPKTSPGKAVSYMDVHIWMLDTIPSVTCTPIIAHFIPEPLIIYELDP